LIKAKNSFYLWLVQFDAFCDGSWIELFLLIKNGIGDNNTIPPIFYDIPSKFPVNISSMATSAISKAMFPGFPTRFDYGEQACP
jgi:hypothetical protein